MADRDEDLDDDQDDDASFLVRREVVHFLEDDGLEFIVGPRVFQICDSTRTRDDGSKLAEENDIQVIAQEVVNSISNTEKLSQYNEDRNNEQGEISFNTLPREIILNIFQYFSVVELCLCVTPVCKQWYEIGHDPGLWKELDFSKVNELPSTSLCRIISQAKSLKKLNLKGRLHVSTAEVAVFSQCIPLLESLNMGFCNDVNETVIDYFMRNCPRLTSINVEGCVTVNDKAMAPLLRGKNLQEINFSHCSVSDDSIIRLASGIKQIVSINIDGISWISDSAVVTLVDQQSRNLQELVLDGAELTDRSIHHIARCTNLRKLQISFCEGLSDQALRYIQTLQKLTNLKMRKGLNFSTEGLLSLFSCESMSGLVELDFSENTQFVDDCVMQMTKCCGPRLRNLALSWCWDISDPGIISIVDHCRNLEVLDIIGLHKITGTYFIRIPEDMPKLRLLNLQQCNRIIDELIEDVIRKKPDLRVFNYYGEQFVHEKEEFITSGGRG